MSGATSVRCNGGEAAGPPPAVRGPSPEVRPGTRCYPRQMASTSAVAPARIGVAPPDDRRHRRSGVAWPLIVLFPLLPLWWALGISGLVLSICMLPLAAANILRRRLLVPRGFGLYLLFLLWCAFSA